MATQMAASRAVFATLLPPPSPPPPPPTGRQWIKARARARARARAVGDSTPTTYQGVYGPWSVEPSDVREVLLYRSGLVAAAASFTVAVAMEAGEAADVLYAVGSCGLGVSLLLIHIYVTPIKRALQALWCLGAGGSLVAYTALAAPAGQGLVEYVVQHPGAVWLVGPLFASLTGLVFKEGLCYGKLEAAALTLIIPGLLLGHLSGVMDDGLKVGLLRSWTLLFLVFAGRKFSQPIKDDIGDKSVFLFNSLPEDEKKAVIQRLEQRKSDQNENVDGY